MFPAKCGERGRSSLLISLTRFDVIAGQSDRLGTVASSGRGPCLLSVGATSYRKRHTFRIMFQLDPLPAP